MAKATPEERAARIARLQEAGAKSAQEQLELERKIDSMNDAELEQWINEDPELQDFVCVGDNGMTGELQFDLKAKHTTDNTVDFNPPWEMNFSAAANNTQQQVPQYVNGNLYQPYGNMYMDPRQKAYTKGMRLYNINPYAFICAEEMIEYYEYCENQRRQQIELEFVMRRLAYQCAGDYTEENQKLLEDQFRFKTADEIIEEQDKANAEAYRKNQERMFGLADNLEMGKYDERGYRKRKIIGVKIRIDGELVLDSKEGYTPAEDGKCYQMINIMEDRAKAKEEQDYINGIMRGEQYIRNLQMAWMRNEIANRQFYEDCERRGLTPGQAISEWMYKDVNYKDHEKAIWRALQTTSYSREKFGDILNQLCNTNIDYSNRSHMFCISYDMARDLHFQSLLESEEDMVKDEAVTQKLRDEYDMKRAAFMKKVESRNFRGPDSTTFYYKPTCGKPKIDQLTLEDFNNPVNHVMYTQLYHPEYAMKNSFIPDYKQDGAFPSVDDGSIKLNSDLIEKARSGGLNINADGMITGNQSISSVQPSEQPLNNDYAPANSFTHTEQEIMDLY